MKSYEERLPMIDEAVSELNGNWPSNPDGNNIQDVLMIYRGKYVSGLLGFTDIICTRDEFEKRKAELQNKPSWDSAPDWAKALAQDKCGDWNWVSRKNPESSDSQWDFVGENCNDDDVVLFAKCKGKVIGDWRDTLEQRPQQEKTVSESNWHERGELPPVGLKCEVEYRGKWRETTVVGHNPVNGNVIYLSGDFSNTVYDGIDACKFRPIQSERDKLIEQAKHSLPDDKYTVGDWNHCVDVIEKLINAGWRPTEKPND